jgi:hypothetical protein
MGDIGAEQLPPFPPDERRRIAWIGKVNPAHLWKRNKTAEAVDVMVGMSRLSRITVPIAIMRGTRYGERIPRKNKEGFGEE